MRQQSTTIVVIDDDALLCDLLGKALQPPRFYTGIAHDGASGMEMIAHLNPQFVLLDLDLPDSNGFMIVAQLCQMESPPKIIISSALLTFTWRHLAYEGGVDAILPKPYSLTELLATLKC